MTEALHLGFGPWFLPHTAQSMEVNMKLCEESFATFVNTHFVFPVSFEVVGYGCMTCIGNSGPLPEPVVEAVTQVPRGCFHSPTLSFHIFKHLLSRSLLHFSFFFSLPHSYMSCGNRNIGTKTTFVLFMFLCFFTFS